MEPSKQKKQNAATEEIIAILVPVRDADSAEDAESPVEEGVGAEFVVGVVDEPVVVVVVVD